MKGLLLICAGLLFLGIAELPIGYYTLLRIVVTGGAVMVIMTEFKEEFTFWMIAFGLIGILFNPIIPVYLHDKEVWGGIDFVVGVLFVIKAFTPNIKT